MPAARTIDPVTPEEDTPAEEIHEEGAEEEAEAEEADPAPGHKLWNGDLPAAKGLIAKVFAKIPLAEQRQDANILLTFLQAPV